MRRAGNAFNFPGPTEMVSEFIISFCRRRPGASLVALKDAIVDLVDVSPEATAFETYRHFEGF